MDVSKVLSWSGLSVVCLFIIGYVLGFRAAQPLGEKPWVVLGAITLGSVIIALVWLTWRYMKRNRFSLSLARLWRIEGDITKTLSWACGGILVGGALGGFPGYQAGFRTAQVVYDLLAAVGVIVAMVVVVVVAVVIIVADQSNGKPTRRRRYR